MVPHESRDGMVAHPLPLCVQGATNPGTAVSLATLPMEVLRVGQEGPVRRRSGPLRRGNSLPVICQGAAHEPRCIAAVVSLHHVVSHRDFCTKNAAARWSEIPKSGAT